MKNLGSLVHPDLNALNNSFVNDNLNPVTLPHHQPVISTEALACVQSFANATGIPADRVVSEALLYWWDNYAGFVVLATEKKAN